MILRCKSCVPKICCPCSIQATHAGQSQVAHRFFGLWSPRRFVVASFDVGPMFPCNKSHEAMKNCQDSAFSLCGLEVGLPAFQLPMFAKCDALPKKGLCMFMQHVCQRESMPFVNMEGSNSYQMLEVAESGSTLHQFEVSCLQKIESRYPRFGLQDIDCDLGCLIYETAASQ